jgi:hypothetical protein
MEVDAEQVRARVISANGEHMAGSLVHLLVVPFRLFIRPKDIGDVPHGDRRSHSDGAIDQPVGWDERGFGAMPEQKRQGDRSAWEDCIDAAGNQQLSAANHLLDLIRSDPLPGMSIQSCATITRNWREIRMTKRVCILTECYLGSVHGSNFGAALPRYCSRLSSLERRRRIRSTA